MMKPEDVVSISGTHVVLCGNSSLCALVRSNLSMTKPPMIVSHWPLQSRSICAKPGYQCERLVSDSSPSVHYVESSEHDSGERLMGLKPRNYSPSDSADLETPAEISKVAFNSSNREF